jgi:hypothetical protein
MNGGAVLHLSTDCVSCVFPKDVMPFELEDDNVNIKGFYYDEANSKPKYKLEDKQSRLKHERLPNHIRTFKYEHEELNWTVIEDLGDNDFIPFVSILITISQCILMGERELGSQP